MQHDLNRAEFSGRLVKDVEIRTIGEGEKKFSAASFTLAVGRKPKKDDKGNWVNETDFVNFVCTGSEAENVAKYCQKGDEVIVFESRYQTRSYEKDGKKVYINEFVATSIKYGAKASTNKNGETAPKPEDKNETEIDLSSTQLPWEE